MKLRKSAAMFLASLSLTACDSAAQSTNNGANAYAIDAVARRRSTEAKLNGYVKGYKRLTGTLGFTDVYRAYRSLVRGGAVSQLELSEKWIRDGVTSLKSAHAMPNGATDLDAAADALIASMEKVLEDLSCLRLYYVAQPDMDNDTISKRVDEAQTLAGFNAANADLIKFGDLLEREVDQL